MKIKFLLFFTTAIMSSLLRGSLNNNIESTQNIKKKENAKIQRINNLLNKETSKKNLELNPKEKLTSIQKIKSAEKSLSILKKKYQEENESFWKEIPKEIKTDYWGNIPEEKEEETEKRDNSIDRNKKNKKNRQKKEKQKTLEANKTQQQDILRKAYIELSDLVDSDNITSDFLCFFELELKKLHKLQGKKLTYEYNRFYNKFFNNDVPILLIIFALTKTKENEVAKLFETLINNYPSQKLKNNEKPKIKVALLNAFHEQYQSESGLMILLEKKVLKDKDIYFYQRLYEHFLLKIRNNFNNLFPKDIIIEHIKSFYFNYKNLGLSHEKIKETIYELDFIDIQGPGFSWLVNFFNNYNHREILGLLTKDTKAGAFLNTILTEKLIVPDSGFKDTGSIAYERVIYDLDDHQVKYPTEKTLIIFNEYGKKIEEKIVSKNRTNREIINLKLYDK
jgi:hypothetical protein